MKGYFSRIARQSGLRFSGQMAQPRRFSDGVPTADNLSPLEREETIMIPPSILGKSPSERRETRRSEMPEAPQQRAAAPEHGVGPNRTSVVEAPVLIGESSDEEPVVNERRLVAGQADKVEYPSPAKTENALPGEKPSGEFSVIEQTVFKGMESPYESMPQAVEPAALEAEELTGAAPAATETEKKDYFLKTAAFIEKGEAGTAGINEILFQEIQEWVAGSPVAEEIRDPGTEEVTETIVTKEAVRPQSRQLETIHEKVEAENVERSGFAEQTFELSIGTISVVIEDAEKPRQAEPPPQTANNQNTGRETKREFSRLSRHYL